MRQAFLLRGNARTQFHVVRVIRRRLATSTEKPTGTVPPTDALSQRLSTPQKKKGSAFARIFWTAAFATGAFYTGSVILSFNNSTYYDLFADNVPLAQVILEFAEARKWDRLTWTDVTSIFTTSTSKPSDAPKETLGTKLEATKGKISAEVHKLEDKAKHVVQDARSKVASQAEHVQKTITTKVEKAKHKVDQATDKSGSTVRQQVSHVVDDLADLKANAEAALRGEYPPGVKATVTEVKELAVAPSRPSEPAPGPDSHVYEEPLPIGFEPPHGFKAPKASPPPQLVADEKLAGNLRTEPTPLPGSVPYEAPPKPAAEPSFADLTPAELEARLKEAERLLDEQVREHTLKMLEFEMSAQDALDKQEADFRRLLLVDRDRISQEYRQKMEEELQVQRELIEERLRETLAEQSIELQRRWIREIKVLVEQERGGRLAKINEVQLKLKTLQAVALENAEVLDDSARAKSLSRAVDVFKQTALHSSVKHSFRDELRTLSAIAIQSNDDLLSSALSTLSSSNTPDVGVEPISDLTAWFCTAVSPKAAKMALVPSEDAGLLTHLASSALSFLTFRRLDEGQLRNRAEGGSGDILSTLARTEWHLKTDAGGGFQGLENATRELNQLPPGPAREICEDWLTEARRRLEVAMVIEVLENLSSAKLLLYSA